MLQDTVHSPFSEPLLRSILVHELHTCVACEMHVSPSMAAVLAAARASFVRDVDGLHEKEIPVGQCPGARSGFR